MGEIWVDRHRLQKKFCSRCKNCWRSPLLAWLISQAADGFVKVTRVHSPAFVSAPLRSLTPVKLQSELSCLVSHQSGPDHSRVQSFPLFIGSLKLLFFSANKTWSYFTFLTYSHLALGMMEDFFFLISASGLLKSSSSCVINSWLRRGRGIVASISPLLPREDSQVHLTLQWLWNIDGFLICYTRVA